MDAFVKRLSGRNPGPPRAPSKSKHAQTEESMTRPQPKRVKREIISDSESDSFDEAPIDDGDKELDRPPEKQVDEEEPSGDRILTDFENVLPPTVVDSEAIEEYEALKASRQEVPDDENEGKPRRRAAKFRKSIYVDAFNLALDIVLDEESNLFNEREMEMFAQWRQLDYEAQHLYVRLFLRKTAAWHRSSRLGYHNDIADPDAAIKSLQTSRELPGAPSIIAPDAVSDIEIDVMDEGNTFTFLDASQDHIKTVDEAASLMYLDELKALAKEAKIQGKVKADYIRGIARVSQQQTRLKVPRISRQGSQDGQIESSDNGTDDNRREASSLGEQHFLGKVMAVVGPCIRVSPSTFKLFERVHLVFYRSTEWTEKSLTTIILAKIARRNFPQYIVCRTSTIFASRLHVLEFEAAIRLEAAVDTILEMHSSQTKINLPKIIDIFHKVYPRWRALIAEEADKEQRVYENGEGMYLRRFNAAHSYTRIVVKATYVFGRLHDHKREHELLTELLDQRLFHLARRGSWYQRKALLEEHYMAQLDPAPAFEDIEKQKRLWRGIAVSTCETGLQDPDCHLIHHYDLQKRLVKLEKRLRIPRRLQHDFGHVRLADPLEIFVEGIQLTRDTQPKPGSQHRSTKTIWLDEHSPAGGECSVEEMCLSHFRTQGWKGYHSEGGIVRTLFAYLFYDILFLYIPNVFQTAFQTCPLDLHTDAFFPTRASEINHRLVEIANGEGEAILRRVWEGEHERRTSVIGLNWDFEVEDLAELVGCFDGSALAALCKVMAQEYRQRGGGMPDLILWRVTADTGSDGGDGGGGVGGGVGGDGGGVGVRGETAAAAAASRDDDPVTMTTTSAKTTTTTTTMIDEPAIAKNKSKGEVMFAEVKSANDRLSDTQRLWIHVLAGAGVKVALCNAVAREVRAADDFPA